MSKGYAYSISKAENALKEALARIAAASRADQRVARTPAIYWATAYAEQALSSLGDIAKDIR